MGKGKSGQYRAPHHLTGGFLSRYLSGWETDSAAENNYRDANRDKGEKTKNLL